MTTDLARHTSQLPAAADWKTMLEMADVFLKSGFLPEAIKTSAAAVTIIAKGRELGIPPLYALSNISIIKGKPVCQAELMLALLYRDHGDQAVQILETSDKQCRVSYKRRGGPRCEFAFTISDAERAGLTKGTTWQQYTSAMLRARCISAVARMAFPDSIAGMYTPEELGARVVVDAEGQVVIDSEAILPPCTQDAAPEPGRPPVPAQRRPELQAPDDEMGVQRQIRERLMDGWAAIWNKASALGLETPNFDVSKMTNLELSSAGAGLKERVQAELARRDTEKTAPVGSAS